MRILLDVVQLLGLLTVVGAAVALTSWALPLATQLLVAGLGVLAAAEVMEWIIRLRGLRGGRGWE